MLFKENERYSREGVDLNTDLSVVIEPIFIHWAKNKGARLRDIAAIAHHVILELECEMLLEKYEAENNTETNELN